VVTGDITQTDLPQGQSSGLSHVIRVLADIDEIGFCHFTARDVVRHPLVQTIVQAYERAIPDDVVVPTRHQAGR
jgi:phosphate starvation-inducible protein PhoH and related proteins